VEQVAGEAQGFFLALLRKPGQGGPNLPEPGPVPGQGVDEDVLRQAGCDPAGLPTGRIRSFGDNVFFLPGPSLGVLPGEFTWRGLPLGRLHKGGFRPNPRLRLLLPPARAGGDLVVDNPEQVEALLTGQSLDLPGAAEPCGLYFRSLPLGRLRLKGRRALWTDR
jgi:16S rRNA (cytosine1407-C5)-methyltransferase